MIRVTELLRWGGIVPDIPNVPAVTEALKRGTAVHEWSLEIEDKVEKGKRRQVLLAMPEKLRSYGEAVANFHEQLRPAWMDREVRIDDLELGITGCPDRYGAVRGEPTVLDFKTGQEQGWHRFQLAIYAILLKRDRRDTDARLCVYLRKDGTFRMVRHQSDVDMLAAWTLIKEWRDRSNEAIGDQVTH